MAKNDVKGTASRIQRLLEDDFTQEQLRAIAGGLRSSYNRAREERGKSVEDKKFYAGLQQVAASTRNLIRAFTRPEPEPEPKHRGRRLAVVAVALAGTAALAVKMQKLETQRKADQAAATTA